MLHIGKLTINLAIGFQTYRIEIMEDILERIQKFVVKERWEYDFPLTRDTRLEQDLRITGIDAVNFIVAFGKEFNVDVSKFMAADYFNDEGIDIIGPLIRLFTGKQKEEKKVLTLGHLEKAVRLGRLDEEVIHS